MKSGLIPLLLLSGALAHSATDPLPVTAFRGLFAAGKAAPQGRLVEISGLRGGAQPQEWTFSFLDPSARGGLREVAVHRGEVSSVRTPLTGTSELTSLPPIQLPLLNYDSDRAFQIAEQQASAARIGFHWADYRLRATASGSPLWQITLIDRMGARVGSLEISAESGAVSSPLRTSPAPLSSQGRAPVGGLLGDLRDLGIGIGQSVSSTVLHTVGTAQEILTGERTIGVREEGE